MPDLKNILKVLGIYSFTAFTIYFFLLVAFTLCLVVLVKKHRDRNKEIKEQSSYNKITIALNYIA